MDVARSSIRLGAEKVSVIYRRTRAEMPANPEEIVDAIEEGIEMLYLNNPKQVLESKGEKLNLECVKMQLGEPDESGRRRPETIQGSEYVLELDYLISAIGQETDVPEGFGVNTNRRGRIEVTESTGKSSQDGVFSGGDVVTGPASVITAIEGGRIAASSIDEYLGGDGDIDRVYFEPEDEEGWIGRQLDFAAQTRAGVAMLKAEDRVGNFSQVEGAFDEMEAKCEAGRCLRCQLRCAINAAPEPPVKNQA
ncbi:FAD-dependent oxidoreductase [Spirochaetota bacterium]